MKQFVRTVPAVMMVAIAGHTAFADDHVADNCFIWNLGSAADTEPTRIPHLFPADHFGDAGNDGGIKYRLITPDEDRSHKPTAPQAHLRLPAFDFDASNHGAANSAFYLRVRFKDVAREPVNVWAAKGGCGWDGAGYVGAFGGAGDNQWKEQTVVIPRSMLRSQDGKTYRIALDNIKAAIPVSSVTFYSGNTTIKDAKAIIASAQRVDAEHRESLRQKLLPDFKDLGLPDPGPAPSFTAAEQERGYRVFFPPIHRQLFANSQPREGELIDAIALEATPGETLTLTAAVRAIKDIGEVCVEWADAQAMPIAIRNTRWARYSEQRIGSSWGKDYRICPEQLVEQDTQSCKPDRLEIATITFGIDRNAKAGEYAGHLQATSRNGGKVTFPIKLTVYPFALQHPDHSTHGQFYYSTFADLSPLEVADMRDHGMDMATGDFSPFMYPDDNYNFAAILRDSLAMDGRSPTSALDPAGITQTAQSRAAYRMFKDLGYRSPMVSDAHAHDADSKDPKVRHDFVRAIREEVGIAKAEGFELGFLPVDEPHEQAQIDQVKTYATWMREVPGARTYETANPNAVAQLGGLLDYVCYNLSYINPQTVDGVRKAGQTLMFYCPSIDVNPELNRYRPGFYQYKLGAFSAQYFAYMENCGDWFCDLDGKNRDWNVVYPSMTSATHDPTLEWEAMRQGVNDWMYCHTLESLAGQARKAGKAQAADQALKVLADVLAPVDVDGSKAGGPAMAIEADTRLKDTKLDPRDAEAAKSGASIAWYDQSRRKIAAAIVELQKQSDR